MSIDDFIAKLEVSRSHVPPAAGRGAVIFMNMAQGIEPQSVRTVRLRWKVARRANFCDGIGDGLKRNPSVLRSGFGHVPVLGCFDLVSGPTSPLGVGSFPTDARRVRTRGGACICDCNAVTRFKCSRFSWKAVRCEQG